MSGSNIAQYLRIARSVIERAHHTSYQGDDFELWREVLILKQTERITSSQEKVLIRQLYSRRTRDELLDGYSIAGFSYESFLILVSENRSQKAA